MIKILITLLISLTTLPAFAQNTLLTGNIQSGGIRPFDTAPGFHVLALDADVTALFAGKDFDKLSLGEVQLALIQGTFGNPDEGGSGKVSVATLFRQMIVLPDGQVKYVQGIQPVSVEVLGITKINEQIHVKYKAYANLALGYKFFDVPSSDFQSIVDANTCAGCPVKQGPVNDTGEEGFNLGAEAGVKFYDIQFTLFASRRTSTTMVYAYNVTNGAYLHEYYDYSKFSQTNVGLRLDYDLVQDKPIGDLGIFASAAWINSRVIYKESQSIMKNGHYVKKTGLDMTRYEGPKGQVGMIEVGLKWTIPSRKK